MQCHIETNSQIHRQEQFASTAFIQLASEWRKLLELFTNDSSCMNVRSTCFNSSYNHIYLGIKFVFRSHKFIPNAITRLLYMWSDVLCRCSNVCVYFLEWSLLLYNWTTELRNNHHWNLFKYKIKFSVTVSVNANAIVCPEMYTVVHCEWRLE